MGHIYYTCCQTDDKAASYRTICTTYLLYYVQICIHCNVLPVISFLFVVVIDGIQLNINLNWLIYHYVRIHDYYILYHIIVWCWMSGVCAQYTVTEPRTHLFCVQRISIQNTWRYYLIIMISANKRQPIK